MTSRNEATPAPPEKQDMGEACAITPIAKAGDVKTAGTSDSPESGVAVSVEPRRETAGAVEGQPPSKRMSIAQLERLLNSEDEQMLEILPNGEVREYSEQEKSRIRSDRKPLTMRENLGGEYAY